MAKNPDPSLKLSTSAGVTRTLDDWSTMFQLCLVILPARAEAAVFVPIAQRIFATLGDADCTTSFVVTGPQTVAERLLGHIDGRVMTFVDPDLELVSSLGLERLPAFVHLRQDTSVGAGTDRKRKAEANGDCREESVPIQFSSCVLLLECAIAEGWQSGLMHRT